MLGFHEYVDPLLLLILAIRVSFPPAHIPPVVVIPEVILKVGTGNTLTTAKDFPPLGLPVTVYVVVTVGDAITLAPVVVFKPVEGAQVKALSP
jgi:hypothetical protein